MVSDILETATFGAGCFWGIEAAFRKIKGVKSTAVGYMGGNLKNPTYEDVCTNKTGHAEVVQIEFDPSIVSYKNLLDEFWNVHDPTQLNKQGLDIGSQYRSVIFYHNPQQKKIAEEVKKRINESERYKKPIVTEISHAKEFYRAEEYHQQYFEKKGISSCRVT